MRRWHVCRMQPVRVQAEGLAHRLPRGGARPATAALPCTFSPSPIPPQGDCGTLRWAQAFFLLAAAYAICYLLFISGILDSRDGGQVKNWTGGNFANCCTYSSECNHHLPAPVPPRKIFRFSMVTWQETRVARRGLHAWLRIRTSCCTPSLNWLH